jgi:hypothetical protein
MGRIDFASFHQAKVVVKFRCISLAESGLSEDCPKLFISLELFNA